MSHSSSTPVMRASASQSSIPASPAPPTPAADEVFSSFLERQAAHLQRKRVAEAKRAEALAAERQLSHGAHAGSQSARGPPSARRASGADGDTRSFLDRVADQSERRRQLSSVAEQRPPSDEIEECTFKPRITHSARARRGRTVDELSTGDLARRLRSHEAKKQLSDAKGEAELTFQPAINDTPGVQSRLKVSSEPESYLARVRQHMKLKEQLTACVREAQESQQLAECTFHPRTHEAPAYISRIAKSVRVA